MPIQYIITLRYLSSLIIIRLSVNFTTETTSLRSVIINSEVTSSFVSSYILQTMTNLQISNAHFRRANLRIIFYEAPLFIIFDGRSQKWILHKTDYIDIVLYHVIICVFVTEKWLAVYSGEHRVEGNISFSCQNVINCYRSA